MKTNIRTFFIISYQKEKIFGQNL